MVGYSFFRNKEQMFTSEQRITKRYKYNSKFKIESVNMQKINIELTGVDISIGGIGFISTMNFNLNDILGIYFTLNNVTIPAVINTKHVNLFDSGFFVGGNFIAMQDSYIDILRTLS